MRETLMNQADIIERVERCRRLARQMTDGHMRNSLEALAEEYESRLPRGRPAAAASFMLRHR